MIISDLEHLEVVSQKSNVNKIVGGAISIAVNSIALAFGTETAQTGAKAFFWTVTK